MISRIIWQLNADKTIQKVTKLTNKLFANGQASAEYCLLADNILPTDVVTATITRDTHTTQYRLKYQLLNLEDGTSKYGWAVTSNGDELNFDLQAGTASLTFAFEVKVYSTIGGELISSYTTQSDTVTVYPGSAYSPKVEATDADKIFEDLAEKDVQIEELQRDKQDKTDNDLQTGEQTIVGAINETYSLAHTNSIKIEQIRTDLQDGTLKPLNSTNADNYSENGTIASKFNEKQNEKPNGVDSLIVNDKLNSKYIPAGLGGGLVYAGTFDATGTITASKYVPQLQGTLITDIDLENSTSLFFKYNGQTTYTLGSLQIDFGDQIICNGNIEPNWSKIDNSDKVTSVNGQVGAVSITTDNIGAIKSTLEESSSSYGSKIEARPSLASTSTLKEPTFDFDIDYTYPMGTKNTRVSITKDGMVFKNRLGNTNFKPTINGNTIAYETDIPTTLPNPQKLIIQQGEEVTEYNGSEEKTIVIESGGGKLNLQDLPQFTNKIEIDMSKATSLAGLLTLPIVESSNFYVNWGDGSGTMYTEATTEISHQYSDTNFAGWITIYGDWKGIQFEFENNNNAIPVISVCYDNNITNIEQYALYACKNLKVFNITDNVSYIGPAATKSEVLLDHYPTKLTALNGHMFGYPQIRNKNQIIIPYNIRNIANYSIEGDNNNCTVYLNGINLQSISSNAIRFNGSLYYGAIIISHFVNAISFSSNFVSGNLDYIMVDPTELKKAKQKTNLTVWADKIYPIGGNYSETITIPSTAWDSETKTVTVEAVGATSETRNLIIPSVQGNNDNNVRCTAQGTMSLTFTCDTVPTEDTVVDVSYILTNKNV